MSNPTNKIRHLNQKDCWDYENGFYWFSEKSRINRLLTHYELYKEIVNLPGHVLEFGVYKAVSLVRFATFRNALECDDSRKIIGFDAFGKFPTEQLNVDEDIDFIERFENAGGDGLDVSEVEQILVQKGFSNIELRKGNVFDTLPQFLQDNPELRIALLHLDMDVKEPTEFALNELYDRVVPGGLIVIDDYNAVAGATQAIDEFIETRNIQLTKLPFYHVPTVIKKP